jgi:hypothetical protein
VTVGVRVSFVAVGALALAACGGSSRLSKSQYQQKIKAEGSSLQAAFTALNIQQNAKLSELATKLASLQGKVEQTAKEIEKLKPPKDAEADNAKIADTLHRFAAIFGDLKRDAQARDRAKLLVDQQKLVAASSEGTQATNDLKQKGYDVGTFGG